MRHHHTGSGRRSVFPPDWQSHHTTVIDRTFEATVTIGDPDTSTSTFNDSTGLTETTIASPVYTGDASIAMISDPRFLEVVDQPNTTSLYQVTLPWEVAGIGPNDIIHIDSSPDPMLTGRDLMVDGPEMSDRRFSRVVNATLRS